MSNVDLLNMNPNRAFKVAGAVADDYTSSSVSSAGDMNGDGFNDIIVGADNASPNGKIQAGAAYVIYGKSGGMIGVDTASTDLANFTVVQGFKILGAAAYDHTGSSVSNVGDINGDGLNDIVFGANNASLNGKTKAGAVYVVYGKNTGFTNIDLASFTAAQGFVIMGAAASDQAGGSVSSAGDINGDGLNDIVVGAIHARPNGRSDAGAAYVIYGKNSEFTNIDLANFTIAQGFTILGAAAYDHTGISVSSAGDINGDGFNDITVGANLASPNGIYSAGITYVIYGKNTGFTNIDLANFTIVQGFTILGAAVNDYTGSSVSSAGDINNDGFNDIVVGARGANPNGRYDAGAAYVIYGKNTEFTNIDLANFTTAQGFEIMGAAANYRTGDSVNNAGDINGDGLNDIVVGAYCASPNGMGCAGAAYVIYGKNAGFTNIDLANFTVEQGFEILGTVAGDWTGSSVSNVGDINNDGFNDIIVGAPFADPGNRSNAGTAYVIYGKKLIIASDENDIIFPSMQPEDIECLASTNVVNYTLSNFGINVNLTANIGVGGYAAGDIIYNCENIIGSSYNDTLTGDSNANNIQGGAGDDVIEGLAGADTLDGGAGTDSLIYISSSAAISVSLTDNTATGGDATGDIISSFENIIGSSYNDALIGDANANNIQGGVGDDMIEGMAGADILDGGSGTDSLSYKSSSASVMVFLADNIVDGGDATGDIISNFENIIGTDFFDILEGDANANDIQGGAGEDWILGGAGDDVIEGMAGPDWLDGEAGVNSLSYKSSPAAVMVILAGNVVDGGDATGDDISNFENIIGSDHGDTLTGDANANDIQGRAGDDFILGGAGADTLDGGADTDSLSYITSPAAVIISLAANTATGGDATGDIISNFENIIGTDFSDILEGDANANDIRGEAGNDMIEGKEEGDVLDGGIGIDTLSYISSTGAVIVSLADNTATGGDATGDIISNFENIIGSSYNDTLTGDSNVNNIQGGAEDDMIEGKAGADTLDGGSDTDSLSYISSTSAVIVSLADNTATGGDATGDIISNFENIIGSDHADMLTGDAKINNIRGGIGNDVIEGKEGGDILDGGIGIDTLSYMSSTGAVAIDLSTNSVTGGDATGDIISSFENIIGSRYADTLTGDVNNNRIIGGAGDDVLRDGDGGDDDVFIGGSDADAFVISSSSGVVTITDFNDVEGDKIDLGDFNVGYNQVKDLAKNSGYDCLITLGDKEIILQNTDKNDMQKSWFLHLADDKDAQTDKLTTEELWGTISSVITFVMTAGGYAYQSYKYYDPERLGYNKFHSWASSMIPKFIMKTTANIIKEADAAIKTVVDLGARYKNVNTEDNRALFEKALLDAVHSCKAAAAEATKIIKAAQKTSSTVTGESATSIGDMAQKLLLTTTDGAEKVMKLAERAFTSYTSHYQGYEGDLAKLLSKTDESTTMINPIGIALSDNKITLVSFNASSISFDYNDIGVKTKTAWVGSQDAFLIYDHNDNKQVDSAKELVLTKWSKTATGDFEALKEVFDSNKDNKFDANDTEFGKFHIWQDKNQDGISQSDELTSLLEAGLLQINFNTEKTIHDEFFGKEQNMNVAEVLWADGTKTLAYDLALETTY